MLRYAILALALTACAPAHAQNACGDRESVVDRLAEGYGETRRSIGLAPNNAVLEMFASLETGTWTIIVTQASGLTCVVATGQAYEEFDPEIVPSGSAL